MTGGHNKVEYCSGSHLREGSFRCKDLSLALALSLGRARPQAHSRAGAGSVGRTAAPTSHA